MNKCSIEFPNHNLYICHGDVFCYINLMLDKQDALYHFVQFVYQTKHMLYGIKQVNKVKSKKRKLRRLVYECIDDILTDIIMHDAFEYVSIPYFLKDNKCLDIYICSSNNYRDTFAGNISIDRLKTKIPLLFSAFGKI